MKKQKGEAVVTFSERLEAIAAEKRRLASDEVALMDSRDEALRRLPEAFGFASLGEFISALRGRGGTRRRRRIVKRPRKPSGEKAVEAPPDAVAPVCSDLSKPKDFRLMPEPNCLRRVEGEDAAGYRQRLAAELRNTEKILHTSGVVAAVWRSWREHERAVRAALATVGG